MWDNNGWFNSNPAPIPITWQNAAPSDGRIQFFEVNGITEWSQCNNPLALRKLYEATTPLAADLNILAQAFTNAKIQAIKSTTENPVKGKDTEWQKLLDQPNPQQGQKEFFKDLYIYMKLAGWCYVLKRYPSGYKDRPSQLWVLPPWMLEFQPLNNTAFYNLTDKKPRNDIYFSWTGFREKLDPKDLILFKDTSVTYNEFNWLPNSRIMSMGKPISLILAILEANLTLITNKGALGIISNETEIAGTSIPWGVDEKNNIQNQFQNSYGLRRDKFQMLITDAALKYTPIAFDVTQLGTKDLYLQCCKDLADGLGLPFALSAHSDQSTYNNIIEAEKRLYQDTIIPDAQNIFDTLEYGIGANGANVEIEADYSHIEALQDNAKEAAEALRYNAMGADTAWKDNAITLNEYRLIIGQDKITNGDIYYYQAVEQGIITIPATNNNNTNGEQQGTGANA